MTDMNKEDMELTEMFHGGDKPMHPDTIHVSLNGFDKPTGSRRATKDSNPDKKCTKEEKLVNEQWEPEKPAPNYMDKLRTSAKDMALYVVLSGILFWWQQTGRLDETTAWYALLFCVGMVFFTIGRAWSGVNK